MLDRATGELLSANNFAFVNWTRGIDADTGRPIVDPRADYDQGPALVFPSEAGAHSWQPMAYDPGRGLTFIPVIESGNVILESSERRAGLVEGQFTTPAFPPSLGPEIHALLVWGTAAHRPARARNRNQHRLARLLARLERWQHRVVWEAPTATSWDGGVLATGGGLVFQGDANGYLNAYSADTGGGLRPSRRAAR